jgi:hypothetical protein
VNERESAEDGDILSHTQADVRRRLRRAIRDKTGGRFRGVGYEAGGSTQQNDEHVHDRRMMAENLDREERPADRTDNCVNGVPRRIDPRHFVGKKFEEIKDACNGHDPRLAEDFERLITGRECDPVLMNREAGDEDSQIQIDASEAGKPERHAHEIESVHGAISDPARPCHVQPEMRLLIL